MELVQQTDENLVLLFQKGNNEAFETLVLRYKNSLYQYIVSLVRDEATAGDLFQEMFIAFFKRPQAYQPNGKFKAWLFVSARNRILNFLRDQKQLLSLDAENEDENVSLNDTLADDTPLPLEELEKEDTLSRLQAAIKQLPLRQQEIVNLRQEFSFQEIAELTHRPLGTVLADGHRAIKKLQQLLSEQ